MPPRCPHWLDLGTSFPTGVLTNETLAAEFQVDPEWIVSVCGIETRRVVAAEETVCDLAERAARACLQDAGITADKLGAIIACTGTPHRQFPGVSAEVQKRLNAPGIPAFDLHLASIPDCSAWRWRSGCARCGGQRSWWRQKP